MAWTMARVDSRRPPGVPIETMTSCGVLTSGFAQAAFEVVGGDGLNGVVDGQFDDDGLSCWLSLGGDADTPKQKDEDPSVSRLAMCGWPVHCV